MNKRNLLITLVVLLLITILIGVALSFRLAQPGPIEDIGDIFRLSTPEVSESYEVELIPPKPGDPIIKGKQEDGIVYDLIGSFTEKLEIAPSKLIKGKFVLAGDPLARNIDVFIGITEGTTYFGSYPELEGKVAYKYRSNQEVVDLVKPGDKVKLRLEIKFPTEDRSRVIEYIKGIEAVLDQLIREFQTDSHALALPSDFTLPIDRMELIP